MRISLKIPFRQIYCNNVWDYITETFWCFVVLKVYPHAVYLHPIAGHPELCPWCAGEYKSPMEHINKYA